MNPILPGAQFGVGLRVVPAGAVVAAAHELPRQRHVAAAEIDIAIGDPGPSISRT